MYNKNKKQFVNILHNIMELKYLTLYVKEVV